MIDALTQFKEAMQAVGLEPPVNIEPGKFLRFPGIEKAKGNTAGWCIWFEDGLGGCFGDWSQGFTENWQNPFTKTPTQAEQIKRNRRIEEARHRADSERQQLYVASAEKAQRIWNGSSPAKNDHPYLVRKGIEANGARVNKDTLVIPLKSDNQIQSLQFISEDGTKRFLANAKTSGGYFSIGKTYEAVALCITEGFATGATIHQATGFPVAVAVAFTSGNLQRVAEFMRQKLPTLPILIFADDDSQTKGNPGITRASSAAESIDGIVAIPNFGEHNDTNLTDFNDMAMGLEAVAKSIYKVLPKQRKHSDEDTWLSPLPLLSATSSEPYPLDALPKSIREAVEEVLNFTKAPTPLVASSALAALSLAAQAHADVKRAEKLQGPTGLFLLTIADSGERKSTCDGFFSQAIKDFELRQAENAKPLIKNYQAAVEAWEAKRSGIKEKIRQLAKSGKTTREQEESLRELEYEKPEQPRIPRLIYGDATPEALKWNLAKAWPSAGVISSEAGLVFGAHGMSKDSVMRNLATLNQLWDGGSISTERRSTESFTVRGARLTIALQVQEVTLRNFFDRSGGLARGTGFLARFLVAWPESTQGFRPFTEAPESWPALAQFNQYITEILEQSVPIDENGALSPFALPLAENTKLAWISFHDAIEKELRANGELHDIRDVASKIADNAARIAGLFQVFINRNSRAVELAVFEAASRIAAWHLQEAQRFFAELALPDHLSHAIQLNNWLRAFCHREKTTVITRREIQRNIIPINLRHKDVLDSALDELEQANRICLIMVGKRKEIYVNPKLMEEDSNDII